MPSVGAFIERIAYFVFWVIYMIFGGLSIACS